jgi:HEAT repeat protein
MRKLLILMAMAAGLALQGQPLQGQNRKDYYKDIKDALNYFKSDRTTDKSFALATLVAVQGMVSSDPSIRKAANEAIGSVNPKLAGPVAALVNGQNYELRLQGIQQLGQLGPDGVAAVPALLDFLKQAKPEDKLAVVQTIGTVGAKDPQVAELIAAMALKDPDPTIQNAAAATLSKMPNGGSTVDVFLSTLNNDRDPRTRLAAIQGLAAVGRGNASAAAELERLAARDPNPDISAAAKAALRKLQPPK